MDREIMGVARQRFDDRLLAVTRDLSTALAAAATCEADRVDTAHVVLALARIPGGVTEGLFVAAGLPADAFDVALREETGRPGSVPACDLTRSSLTEALQATAAELSADGTERPIDERRLLSACLGRLSAEVVAILRDWARIDVGTWLDALGDGADASPPDGSLFDHAGALVVVRFTDPARRHLEVMQTEAAQLNQRRLGTLSLLRAFAVAPNGLLEQGVSFLGQDMRTVRTQLLAVTGRRGPDRTGAAPTAVRGSMDDPLVAALEEAGRSRRRRGGDGVDERDLLEGLLALRAGLAASFLSECGIDPSSLLRFATTYYTPPEDTAPEDPTLPLDEALAWMRERVIGQEAALDVLRPRIELIKRGLQRGFRSDDRSRGTFLFCGPSGTGKTMTARAIARVVYGSEDDVLVFEMGQFNARESINNFIGAAPGYIGYGEGKLTNGLRDNPRRVLLFDEVEKAEGRVFDALLRLLDEGRISDPAGPVRDASDSTIVLTSNLAADEFARLTRLRTGAPEVAEPFSLIPAGPGAAEPPAEPTEHAEDARTVARRIRAILLGFFRPEFLNRIDEIVVFEPFGEPELRRIAISALREQAARVRDQLGVELSWSDEVPARLTATAIERRAGEAARGVIRCVHDLLPELLRTLDEAELRGEQLTAVRVASDHHGVRVVAAGDPAGPSGGTS